MSGEAAARIVFRWILEACRPSPVMLTEQTFDPVTAGARAGPVLLTKKGQKRHELQSEHCHQHSALDSGHGWSAALAMSQRHPAGAPSILGSSPEVSWLCPVRAPPIRLRRPSPRCRSALHRRQRGVHYSLRRWQDLAPRQHERRCRRRIPRISCLSPSP